MPVPEPVPVPGFDAARGYVDMSRYNSTWK